MLLKFPSPISGGEGDFHVALRIKGAVVIDRGAHLPDNVSRTHHRGGAVILKGYAVFEDLIG